MTERTEHIIIVNDNERRELLASLEQRRNWYTTQRDKWDQHGDYEASAGYTRRAQTNADLAEKVRQA